MPTYLLHGFRWPRPSIRVHIILRNIDDAAAEWISSPSTSSALLHSFRTLYPSIMTHLPHLQFIEQYDPSDESAAATSQPFAFVADRVEECGLSADVGEVMARGVGGGEGWGALVELRDQLAGGGERPEKVGWWVVYCGDLERGWEGRGEGGEGSLGEGKEEGGEREEVSCAFLAVAEGGERARAD